MKRVNMAISKQRKKLVYIVEVNSMVVQLAMNANMKKMKQEQKLIILHVKIVIRFSIIIL